MKKNTTEELYLSIKDKNKQKIKKTHHVDRSETEA